MAETLDDSTAGTGSWADDLGLQKGPEKDGGGDGGVGGGGGSVVKEDERFNWAAEIDTTAPFGSVKEAVSRFGGLGFWKPTSQNKVFEAEPCDVVDIDMAKVQQQAAELEKELVMKEKETLNVLKELESTKMILEELKLKLLQQEEPNMDAYEEAPKEKEKEKEKDTITNGREKHHKLAVGNLSLLCPPSAAPGLILLELKHAKLNLARTTNDLAEIRASVESYNKKIEKERISLEKARGRLSSNSSKIASLEQELDKTRSKLKSTIDNKDISVELQRLNSEAEKFKEMGEAAKREVMRAMSEIELTKTRIKTAEIRLVAAKKMKEAARATEAVALSEIKALEKSSSKAPRGDSEEGKGIITTTLAYEEFSSLTSKARDSEESSKMRVTDAMARVDEANLSKNDILQRIGEVMEEVQTSKKALEEALDRVDAANMAKLAVEEALRKWRSEHGGQKRRWSVQNSTRFKNSSSSPAPPHLIGNNTLAVPVLKPTLSIGQILSRKLLVTEEFEGGGGGGGGGKKKNNNSSSISGKRKISLGQMLGKQNVYLASSWKLERQSSGGGAKKLPAKRKKFGFARFSLLLAKKNNKKKKSAATTVVAER